MVHLGPLCPSGAPLQTASGLKILHMSDMTQPAYIILNSYVLCMESELRYMAVFDHLVSLYNTLLSLVNKVCKERHLCCLDGVSQF